MPKPCRIVLLYVLTILFASHFLEARVISYAPYTNRPAVPVIQSRMNRHFVLLESASPQTSGSAYWSDVVMYDSMGQLGGFGLMDMLASFALFDNDPARVNTLDQNFQQVTPDLILKTAKEYLRPGNRTILTIVPKSAAGK